MRKKLFLTLTIIILLAGVLWQKTMMDKETNDLEPHGKLYSINNHKMNLYGIGEGDTTVVFLSGSGTPCAFTDFYTLQRELSQYARTVSYDHPGYGWSEETDMPKTIDVIVDELHQLLESANESAPYILVGHSLASLEALRFAQKYPNEVSGIVLLDGGSPEFYANYSETKSYILNRSIAGARVIGMVRALGTIGVKLPLVGENLRYTSLPSEIKNIDITMYYNHVGDSSNLNFLKNTNENAQAVIEGGYLRDIPLAILSSDSGGDEWEKAQKTLLDWSNNSYKETIVNSDHYIHWSNPEEVIDKIEAFILNN